MGSSSDKALPPQAGRIGVWWVDLHASAPENDVLFDLLDDHERQRAGRFRKAEHQDAYLRSHAALRLILGTWLNCREQDVDLYHPEGDKPSVQRSGDRTQLDFSLSHSADTALIGVTARGCIGVDVEQAAPPESLDIARRWFAPDETAWLEPLPVPARSAAFLACWTAKEAYLKALGLGLSGDLRTCRCRLNARGDIVPEVMDDQGAVDRHWRFIPMIRGEVVGCLAIQGNDTEPCIDVFAWP